MMRYVELQTAINVLSNQTNNDHTISSCREVTVAIKFPAFAKLVTVDSEIFA